MKLSKTSTGNQAEDLAADYLKQQGMKLLARNIRCPGGEVDIVGELKNVVVFVEVRLRSSDRFGGAAASITRSKQKRVVLAASHWLTADGRRYANKPCRFDAILFSSMDIGSIEWLQGAFSAD